MAFRIVLDGGSLQFGNQTYGRIWVELDGAAFPDDEWIDFPVVIVGWWLQNIRTLILGNVSECRCRFMDGPYYFEVSKHSEEELLIILVHDSSTGRAEVGKTLITHKEMSSELVSAGESLSRLLRANAILTDDDKTLIFELQAFTEASM